MRKDTKKKKSKEDEGRINIKSVTRVRFCPLKILRSEIGHLYSKTNVIIGECEQVQ